MPHLQTPPPSTGAGAPVPGPHARVIESAAGDPVPTLLAGDHPAARTGVRIALESAGFRVAAEVDDAEAALRAVGRQRPRICLMDIAIPGGGLPACRRIKAEFPGTLVILLADDDRAGDLFEALRADADGFLLKSMP